MRGSILVFCILFVASHACAQDLVSGVSQDEVEITSSYAGTSITVFGAIEGADNTPSTQNDVVVVIRGPTTDMTVRRKARIAGLWINRDQMKLYGMPGYYFVASSRALEKIASAQTLARYQIGLSRLMPLAMATHVAKKGEPFRIAAIDERASTPACSSSTLVPSCTTEITRRSSSSPNDASAIDCTSRTICFGCFPGFATMWASEMRPVESVTSRAIDTSGRRQISRSTSARSTSFTPESSAMGCTARRDYAVASSRARK